jgi:hypothetical protein
MRQGRAGGARSIDPSCSSWICRGRPTTPLGSVARTRPDFIRRLGVYLSESETSGQDAKLVVETVGDAATVIQVGPYDAALVHSSPFPGGFRTWNLYWSDSALDYAMIGNVAADDLIGSVSPCSARPTHSRAYAADARQVDTASSP